jgi:hypothetical protein
MPACWVGRKQQSKKNMLQLLTNEIQHRLALESIMMPTTYSMPHRNTVIVYHKNSKITSSSACSSALLLLTVDSSGDPHWWPAASYYGAVKHVCKDVHVFGLPQPKSKTK